MKTILEYLAAGESYDNILEAYSFLEEADIKACIQFAAKTMNNEYHSLIAA